MLPELILREEKQENVPFLFLLGLASSVLGYGLASFLFPSEADLLGVFFASIPLIFPLTAYFLDDEKRRSPHIPEIKVYFSIFAGEVLGFFLLGLMIPEAFEIQISRFGPQLAEFGITGYATAGTEFAMILANNIMVFTFILGVSALIGSAGAFILTWNGSVLGVFLAILSRELSGLGTTLSGNGTIPPPWAYLPHATFEMAGFIVAGLSGSLVSAALYREHFDKDTWLDMIYLVLGGISLIITGAGLEAGVISALAVGLGMSILSLYLAR